MPNRPQSASSGPSQITFTVPATIESAETVSHRIMQMANELGRSATEELRLGSDVFQRFTTYVMERSGKTAKVECRISWTAQAGFQLSLTDAA